MNKTRKEICDKYIKKHPWYPIYSQIKQRCRNPNHRAFKWYGGRGIKCYLTLIKVKKLWFRDKAYLLLNPSIDRKNNNGNYTYKNCKFIELDVNRIKNRCKTILQLDLNGVFIKEWISINEASRTLKISTGHICKVLKRTCSHAHNFIWIYKDE